MSEWHPIETAPKDGTDILTWDGTYRRVGHWNEDADEWYETFYGIIDATHWQPLPSPPETPDA